MIKVLIVEDDSVTRKLLERIVVKRGYEVRAVESAEDALVYLEKEFFPLLLVDVQLPGMSGIELCRKIRAMPMGDRYFILVGTMCNESEDLKMILQAGADDYVAKPYNPQVLNVRLTIAEQQIIHLAARKKMEDELKFLALHDPLTGLYNRSVLMSKVTETVQSVAEGASAAILYLDLDNFKIVNDVMGHEVGDRLLISVARLLENNIRLGDGLVRFGGDEFITILNNTSKSEAILAADRLLLALENLVFREKKQLLQVNGSCGIAIVRADHSVEQLIANADTACYAAKAQGRNRSRVHNTKSRETKRMLDDADWLAKIRQAMHDDRLKLWFQPIIHIKSGKVSHYEALLRYTDVETHEIINPGVFLPSINRFGHGVQLDYYVIKHVIDFLSTHPGVTLAVNLGGASFADIKLPRFIFNTLREYHVDATRILFEITETEVIANLELARGMMRQLESFGCRFALDDFGKGFCTPHYLRNLPVQMLKLDGDLVTMLKSDVVNQTLVKAILDVSALMHIETVAEYVMDEETYHILREFGVDYAQGEYLGMPQADIY
ncbi:MAG: EAL domain-containing protein, partial [Chthoniobacterales bacterium]